MNNDGNGQTLSRSLRAEIERWLARYPADRKQSAVLAALRAAQHENQGSLDRPLMDAVAAYLGMPRIAVYEAASFYSMLETEPRGRHSVSVCTNISCMLRGANGIVNYLEKKLKVKTGETTRDRRIYLKKEEECLAACCGAPMMMVNHKYYENLTLEKVDRVLNELD